MKTNSKNEFKFVVTGVDLTEEQQEQVSRAIAQAGALALGGLVPRDAVGVRLDPRIRVRRPAGSIRQTGEPLPVHRAVC